MANVAYVRVSTADQNEARQQEALGQYPIDKWFIEKVSARDTDRPKLLEMLDYIREGDTIYVHDLSRLARSTFDLLALMGQFEKNGVRLHSNKESLDTSTAAGKLMLTVLSAISQFERDAILERQREGIAIAKAQGKYRGRQRIEISEESLRSLYDRYQQRRLSKAEICRELNISRPTLNRLFAEYEKAHSEGIP